MVGGREREEWAVAGDGMRSRACVCRHQSVFLSISVSPSLCPNPNIPTSLARSLSLARVRCLSCRLSYSRTRATADRRLRAAKTSARCARTVPGVSGVGVCSGTHTYTHTHTNTHTHTHARAHTHTGPHERVRAHPRDTCIGLGYYRQAGGRSLSSSS